MMEDHEKKAFLENAQAYWRSCDYSEEEIVSMSQKLQNGGIGGASKTLKARMDDIMSGAIWAVPWPWPVMQLHCPSLLPGKVVVVAGSPGASKSFMMLQCVNFWAKEGYLVSILELEGSKAEHLQRLLSQVSECSSITDTAWVKENPLESSEIMARHADWIDEVGKSIHTCDAGAVNYFDVMHWVQERAKANNRIILVDPITAADPNGNVWEKDKQFIAMMEKVAIDYQCTIIVVSHPRKGTVMPCLDSIAGGTAFVRHTRCVVWLEAVDDISVNVRTCVGCVDVVINRRLWLLKVSDGRGTGSVIAFRFCSDSLQLAEQGLILKKKKKQVFEE